MLIVNLHNIFLKIALYVRKQNKNNLNRPIKILILQYTCTPLPITTERIVKGINKDIKILQPMLLNLNIVYASVLYFSPSLIFLHIGILIAELFHNKTLYCPHLTEKI